MKKFKELRQQVAEDYAQDLDLAQKNMARLAKKESGQDKKDYMAVARALNQGNLGAVKKVIKGISTDEIRADILNVLVGYNDLIAKMYPKAVDSKGRLKSGMSVGKLINEANWMDDEPYSKKVMSDLVKAAKRDARKLKSEDDFNDWMADKGYPIMMKHHKPGPFHKGKKPDFVKDSDSDLFDRYKKDIVKSLKLKLEVSESDANWAKSLEKINKQRQLDKISDKDKETLMKIAALLGKEKKRR